MTKASADPLLPIRHYFLFAWVFNLALSAPLALRADAHGALGGVFLLVVWLSYAALYLLPAGLVVWLLGKALRGWQSAWSTRFLGLVAALLGGAVSVVLFADLNVFSRFDFHLNGFVWNLITTPGGIASMGADEATLASFAAAIVILLVVHQWVAWWLGRDGGVRRWLDRCLGGRYRRLLYACLVLSLSERVVYAGAHAQAYTPVLRAAAAFPFYEPTTATHLLQSLGVEVKRQATFTASRDAGLDYPKHPLRGVRPTRPLNIVWLVAESLRGDVLTPEIMPATYAFAQHATQFLQHYSGSNGTRWGLFTQFYGLYGSYWFQVLEERRSPVLVDRLQELDYQLHVSTSSAFSYPEFDRTLWVHVPSADLHLPEGPGPGWRHDRRAVDRIEEFLDRRDVGRPFFVFHFFESAHARYYFPRESVIREPYLEELNYATMDLQRDIGLIFNRYVNSVHHLDSQIGRVLAALRDRGLLQNTIVVITGDHGEEFLEKGHWGHNSQFTQEQTRVPLVLFVPGRAPVRIERLTSHLDLPATLLPLLGVTSDPREYSLGCDLLAPCEREELVFGDWDRIGYADSQYKLVFPLGSTSYGNLVTTLDDRPVQDEEAVQARYQAVMMRLMKEMREFSGRG